MRIYAVVLDMSIETIKEASAEENVICLLNFKKKINADNKEADIVKDTIGDQCRYFTAKMVSSGIRKTLPKTRRSSCFDLPKRNIVATPKTMGIRKRYLDLLKSVIVTL